MVNKRILFKVKEELKDITHGLLRDKSFSIHGLVEMIPDFVEEVKKSKDRIAFTTSKEGEDYIPLHSFDVARLAVSMMQENKRFIQDVYIREESDPKDLMLNDDIYDIALAGFLHDIGKMLVDGRVLKKPDDLTEKEREHMQTHVNKTIEALKNNCESNFTKSIILTIMEHCESFDGSGYPKSKEGYDIFVYSRLLRICDVYASLTSERPFRNGFNPNRARQFMYSMQDNKVFDPELFERFMDMVPPFPVGMEVTLSDGSNGKVHDYDQENRHNPILKVEDGSYIQPEKQGNPNIIS